MSTPVPPGGPEHRPSAHAAPGALPADPNLDPSGAVADEALAEDVAEAAREQGSVGRGARLLTIGIASTGLLTFLFFSVASHALGDSDAGQEQYGQIATMWAILFTAMSVFYRPVEQLLSRTIATARARGDAHPALREPLLIQAGFAAVLVVAALLARGPLQDNIGSSGMFWLLVAAGVAYAASYFARGFVAGHGWFALYGGLVLFESVARILFPIAALVGISSGQIAVAAGILAAPLASLLVVPWAIRAATQRMGAEAGPAAGQGSAGDAGLRAGGSFAVAVALVQLGEQTLVNAGTLLTEDKVAAGLIFSALLVTRAPLQLFQAVQTTLLPHFAALVATGAPEEIAAAIRKAIGLHRRVRRPRRRRPARPGRVRDADPLQGPGDARPGPRRRRGGHGRAPDRRHPEPGGGSPAGTPGPPRPAGSSPARSSSRGCWSARSTTRSRTPRSATRGASSSCVRSVAGVCAADRGRGGGDRDVAARRGAAAPVGAIHARPVSAIGRADPPSGRTCAGRARVLRPATSPPRSGGENAGSLPRSPAAGLPRTRSLHDPSSITVRGRRPRGARRGGALAAPAAGAAGPGGLRPLTFASGGHRGPGPTTPSTSRPPTSTGTGPPRSSRTDVHSKHRDGPAASSRRGGWSTVAVGPTLDGPRSLAIATSTGTAGPTSRPPFPTPGQVQVLLKSPVGDGFGPAR